ncbi:MAG: polyribonucleotide nucleotidyltransferase, partial [Alphaproteobacteria bacterium]|nr:polyribonucleotide nucleotidyltransferase [Alphaproteobacteria bacterium]
IYAVGGQVRDQFLGLEPKDKDYVVVGSTEQQMLDAVTFGHDSFQPVIDMIISLAQECAKDPWEMPEPTYDAVALYKEMHAKVCSDLSAAYKIRDKKGRRDRIDAIKKEALGAYEGNELYSAVVLQSTFKELEGEVVRQDILKTGQRIDGRDTKTIRPIVCEVDFLPRTHGSALFTRGETQAIVVATLGTKDDEQIIDALDGEFRKRFLLHYNFPPYSVGEVGRMGTPGRREIGHGELAWRAINPVLPSKEEFPYTIRIVSEITESNGSSSMATVCGSSLALQAAGVPLAKPVAGIAMGLIKEKDQFAVLSDILGDEDHLGDMDFKVAGTKDGITSLQMDIKITSITKEIMEIALHQAQEGRMHILGEMAKAISTPRSDLSDYAPRITVINIDKDKIREVIGSGGKVIREITETTGVKIEIEDDGTIRIASNDGVASKKAIDWIQNIVAVPELNKIYEGKVVRMLEFGAFVNFLGNHDGLVHISEIANRRINKVEDELKLGDVVKVKVIGFDDRGKIRLSMKQVEPAEGSAEPASAAH